MLINNPDSYQIGSAGTYSINTNNPYENLEKVNYSPQLKAGDYFEWEISKLSYTDSVWEVTDGDAIRGRSIEIDIGSVIRLEIISNGFGEVNYWNSTYQDIDRYGDPVDKYVKILIDDVEISIDLDSTYFMIHPHFITFHIPDTYESTSFGGPLLFANNVEYGNLTKSDISTIYDIFGYNVSKNGEFITIQSEGKTYAEGDPNAYFTDHSSWTYNIDLGVMCHVYRSRIVTSPDIYKGAFYEVELNLITQLFEGGVDSCNQPVVSDSNRTNLFYGRFSISILIILSFFKSRRFKNTIR